MQDCALKHTHLRQKASIRSTLASMTIRTEPTAASNQAPKNASTDAADVTPAPAPRSNDAPPSAITAARWTKTWFVHRFYELLRFGSVGGVAFLVDVGLFNLLRFGPGELLLDKPLTAKVISVAIATLVSWLGNRYWTFAERRTENRLRELIGFAVVNVGGLLIALACLWFSHYILGYTSALADNISGNVIGLLLGMIFRYFAYRHLVFTKRS